ncbi:MAG: protein translocase subunit SecD, partial [Planctomycetota bacterium]
LVATDAGVLQGFPGAGGVVEIGSEKIRYASRVADQLNIENRGEAGTAVVPHAAGATVVLVSDDQIERLITELGDMRFYIGATDADFTAAGKDMAAERQKVVDWLKKPENAQVSIGRFNSLTEAQGGPPPQFRWFPHRTQEGQQPRPREDSIIPLAVPKEEWTFTGANLASVAKSQDGVGFPAVSFQMKPDKVGPFGDFTGSHVNEGMAIVLNDEVVSLATINEKLPGQAQISGRFTDSQVDSMVKVLRSGSLQIKPVLQQREDVGATVGEQYVDQGWIMALTAIGVIILFMCGYYRWLGLYASIGLLINLLMQMGMLVAFQAILTMPGIAGIILGVGMAVDANILIFDRIREEQESGKKPLQAAKAGFGHAMSAIVDSNVTTVLSGLILYFIGTGPIRGFAVTLIIGVLTSMFAALLIVRVLVHYHLERFPNQPFKMKRWLADANYDVVGKTKYALIVSAVLMIAGFGLFIWLEPKKKFGIDFLGGATLRVRTEQPVIDETLRSRVQGLGGEFASAEVVGLPASKVAPKTFTQFRITFKADHKPGEEGTKTGSEGYFKQLIAHGLEDLLQKNELTVKQTQGPESSAVEGTLYFETMPPLADVKARLESAELKDVQTSWRDESRKDVVSFTGGTRLGISDDDLPTKIKSKIISTTDSTGKPMRLAEQIPESSIIGRQVVDELRNSAIIALVLSMFMTVIYIRVRFSEYSYGLAAVSSLIHDLMFTVGAISFLIWIPFIHTEFDMGSIAVFLTIVGYSINDTIIVFDRIRENRPRMKGTLEEIVNKSINQTFSRTIMTSGTTVATILIVLLFNLGSGNVLEGFAFAMTFGIATGTFSSIYIAAPIFIWLEKRAIRNDELEREREELAARNPGSKSPVA